MFLVSAGSTNLNSYRETPCIASESSCGDSDCTISDGEFEGSHQRSSSRKRSRREEDKSNNSASNTIVNNEATITVEFVKCVGLKTPIDEQFFIYFPFQVYEFKECHFVTEYKSFHGTNCYKNDYRYCKNSFSETVNIDCYNLKYNVRLNKI
jgi:hypothetical protein